MENLLPLASIVMILAIPIVAILTAHQRKMAEMLAAQQRALAEIEARRTSAPAADVNAQYEIQMLRDRLAKLEAQTSSSLTSAAPTHQQEFV